VVAVQSLAEQCVTRASALLDAEDYVRALRDLAEKTLDLGVALATYPNTDSLLKLLAHREIILYGVVTEICVDRAARGLIKRRLLCSRGRGRDSSPGLAPWLRHDSGMSGGMAGRLLTTATCCPVLQSAAGRAPGTQLPSRAPLSRASHVYEESSTSAGGRIRDRP
jgi:hypothetical protein